jgi:hypothetical protein
MLLLYAVVPAGEEECRSAGLHRLDGVSVGVAFEERAVRPGTERTEVMEYARKLMALARRTSLLPMRYGTVVGSGTELAEVLSARESAWRDRLQQVAGHREMLVHIAGTDRPTEPAVTARSGREYLLDRAAQLRQESAVLDDLCAAVADEVTEVRRLATAGEQRLACLVPEQRVRDFEAAVDAWSAGRTERVWRTGPWPPFSFTEEVTGE